ncbi:MAG TPA: hypothetical protein DDW52_05055 [Planctomycetaceae bacterium]|nr:hypothetical protein [Planctomycetaceae bacterium]
MCKHEWSRADQKGFGDENVQLIGRPVEELKIDTGGSGFESASTPQLPTAAATISLAGAKIARAVCR